MMMNEDTPGAGSREAAADAPERRPGERLAKAIARAGLGSRREAEGWIGEGRVSVNGVRAETAALNVLPHDRVEVDGRPLPARERTRLWLYHKPRGYVTTTHDPEGRETVFSILPPDMPRVVTIGRLDINTEGLLLLTNDGGLARVLELPETGWLRRYRVRAFGRANPDAVAALKDGVTIDDFAYGSIEAEIERQQNDNVWLRFGLREGKNREVKRVAEHLGLSVNRLIRISFGPFQLGSLPEGGVEEVRSRTLKEQLGKRLAEEAGCDFESAAASFGDEAPRVTGGRGRGPAAAPAARPERSALADPSKRVGRRAPVARPRDAPAPAASSATPAERPARVKRGAAVADRKGRAVKVERLERDHADAAPKRVSKRETGVAERFGAAGRPARPPRAGAKPAGRDARPPRRDDGRSPRSDEARPARAGGARPPRRDDARPERRDGPPRGPRPPRSDDARPPRRDDARPSFRDRPAAKRPLREGDRAEGSAERPRPAAARMSAPRWRDDAPKADGAPRGPRPAGDRPRPGGARPPRRDDRPTAGSDRPRAAGDRTRPTGDRPRPGGARPPRRDQEGGPARDRPERADRPRAPRAAGDEAQQRSPRGDRPQGAGRPGGAEKPGGKSGGFKPRGPGGKPGGARPGGSKPGEPRPGGGKGRPGGADRRR